MKILIVVDSINIEDSSGSKANVALINNLAEAGFEVFVFHYTLKNIQLEGIQCIAITEIKYSTLYFLSRLQRILSRSFNISVAPLLEKIFGFSFTFFNDTSSIIKCLKKMTFEPDLVLTLSKGGSFRPHYAVLKCPELHRNWMAYIHDPYPFHFYPRPYTWVESSYKQKEIFFAKVSEKAKYSAFPSQLLLEWMGSFYPNFLKTGVVIPHQNARYEIQNQDFPSYFDPLKFNLLHAGNLMKPRSPEGLIEGLLLFFDKNKDARDEVRLLLLGPSSNYSAMLDNYEKIIPELIVYNKSFLFDDVYNIQKNTSVNIIIEAKSEISPFLPAKFPHCVEANKTILSLSPYLSEVKRLLGVDYEYWSEVDDCLKISELIEQLYYLWKVDPDKLLLNRVDLQDYLSVNYLKQIINNLENNNIV
ncbi:UDP-glycosyltransferase [Flavobacterium sp. ZB4P23]|uniref:UDP-glycosyltransferase n=1 Tax=Flavobacterium sp. ZB4P23 TaxID=2497484 RepID=UPI000F820FBD|nr:UDP-glycosyltransferase [Flavobacterium sp. ZB4P23]RTY83280.1 UDP-glycosyltransferase [Flavobacterium sp. ZB4P23]